MQRFGARKLVVPFLLCLLASASADAVAAQEPVRPAPGKVLLIRGIFNVFSTGIDTLAEELQAKGYDVEVAPPSGCWSSALRLRDAYLEGDKGPIVLIGHSMGGRACLHIARYLESYKIPVDLIVILDSNPWTTAPDNVRRCVNLYVTNSYGVFHGSPVQSAGSVKVINVDVTKVARPQGVDPVNHFNIEKSPWMHDVVINEVARAHHSWNPGFVQPSATPPAGPVEVRRPVQGTVESPSRGVKRFIEIRL